MTLKRFDVLAEVNHTATYEAETEEEAIEMHRKVILSKVIQEDYFVVAWEIPSE